MPIIASRVGPCSARLSSAVYESCVSFRDDNRFAISYGAAAQGRDSGRKNHDSAEQPESWEGESPTARAPAAASTTRRSRSRQVAYNGKTLEQGLGPAHFFVDGADVEASQIPTATAINPTTRFHPISSPTRTAASS